MSKIILTFVFERNKVHVVDFKDGLSMVFKHIEIFFNHQKKEKMKLSLDALKERSEAVASEELLVSITGGLEAECHLGSCHVCESHWCKTLDGILDWLERWF